MLEGLPGKHKPSEEMEKGGVATCGGDDFFRRIWRSYGEMAVKVESMRFHCSGRCQVQNGVGAIAAWAEVVHT